MNNNFIKIPAMVGWGNYGVSSNRKLQIFVFVLVLSVQSSFALNLKTRSQESKNFEFSQKSPTSFLQSSMNVQTSNLKSNKPASSILDNSDIDIVGEAKNPLLIEQVAFSTTPIPILGTTTTVPKVTGYEPKPGGSTIEPIYSSSKLTSSLNIAQTVGETTSTAPSSQQQQQTSTLLSSPSSTTSTTSTSSTSSTGSTSSTSTQATPGTPSKPGTNELTTNSTDKRELTKIVGTFLSSHPSASNEDLQEHLKQYMTTNFVQTFLMTFSILLTILILKLVVQCCSCASFITDPAMKECSYILFREVVLVLFALLIVESLNFYQIFSFLAINIKGLTYCVIVALFLWSSMGMVYIICAQRHIKQWRELEENVQNYDELKRIKQNYETVFYRNQHLQSNKIDSSITDKISYYIMRLEFIYPIYLPTLTESFLRKDFDFASYLAFAYGKTLSQFFNTIWPTFLTILVMLNLFKFMEGNVSWQPSFIIIVCIPFVFFFVYLAQYFYFSKIEKKLQPTIDRPEEINFHLRYDIIDPFDQYDNIPLPSYLEIVEDSKLIQEFENPKKKQAIQEDEEDENQQMIVGGQEKKIKTTWIDHSNRHEALFICGRGGQTCSKILLQVSHILGILFLSSFVVFNAQSSYTKMDDDTKDKVTKITVLFSLILSPILMVLIWCVLIPMVLKKFTIITNIEMMKDKDLIEKVIKTQKMSKAKRSYRIYQVLKLIRRELVQALKRDIGDKRLRGITKKQIIESFCLCGGLKNKAIKCEAIFSLARLCGTSFTKQESYLLMKKANSQGEQVHYKEFSLAIEQIINDVKVDAFYLVHHLMDIFFNGREKIKFDEFQTFFGEFGSYFEEEDLTGFLNEVQYIKRGSDEIDINELASMIRDDVEYFSK